MSVTQKFFDLFEGSNLAHGETTVGSMRRNGKAEAKSIIVKTPLSVGMIEDHIKGVKGIGSIPITDKNECKFGVLDIDSYNVDHKEIAKKCKALKIPAVVCRSKSGGAHIFIFMKDWVNAAEFRDHLFEIAAALGFSGCEIFPKQDQILADRGDVGNFINLPYFDNDKTVRYAVDEKGKDLSLQQFITQADKKRITIHDLKKIDFGTRREEFSDAPPCLQGFLNLGVPQGSRNTVLFNVCTYCQKKDKDTWQKMFEDINQKYSSPPLPATEIVALQKQHEKKEYQYQCNVEPLKSHCDKQVCKTRKYGVGNGNSAPSIGGLTILLSDPRLFFLDVNGRRLELSTKQLQMQQHFQEACIEQLNYMPPIMKPGEWQTLINRLLEKATTIEVPEELTMKGQFKELLQTYCTSRIRARSPEELNIGKPWTENDLTYFTIKGLQEFLRQRGFNGYTRPQLQQRLKDLNSGQNCNGVYTLKNDETGKWSNIRVWWVPEFHEEEVELPIEESSDESDIPF